EGHIHLYADQRGSWANKQLVGPRRHIFEMIWTTEWRDARAHHVCCPLYHGTARLAASESRVGNHRFKIRRAQHANHDAYGQNCAEPPGTRSKSGMEPWRAFVVRCRS